jgi:hypothetical protein
VRIEKHGILTVEPGIIPRAAAMLFEKLEGSNIRPSGSGLRAPSRLSGLHNNKSTSSANRNWQLKATYVEVRWIFPRQEACTDILRSTTSSYATFFSLSTPLSTNDHK